MTVIPNEAIKIEIITSANIVFPHQLFKHNPIFENGYPVFLVEEYLFFKQYLFHKQKIAFHRASMKAYEKFLKSKGIKVFYVESSNLLSDVRQLLPKLADQSFRTIHYIDPTDNWLGNRIQSAAAKVNLELVKYTSPLFLNDFTSLSQFFRKDKKRFLQSQFYKSQRKTRNILIGVDENPVGGKWSFDTENRKKYPAQKRVPEIVYPESNEIYQEAFHYVESQFSANPGQLSNTPLYPVDYRGTEEWITAFLKDRFQEFGAYEDAIVSEESILHHSVLSPLLNVGLITPTEITSRILSFAEHHDIPINSTEGIIRQLIGWREFIRGIYECKGNEQRTRNFWNFKRKISSSFYTATTGIHPVDQTIKKVLKTGYCHHIERLMILGNFMLLCEFDPDEVYQWFMELFIDAYDWVMVPNVYGMSQFSDGGLMATKPYFSGSNYIIKMSNYKKGAWQDIWDSLFWRFMHVHRKFFSTNPRLSMLVNKLDRMPEKRKNKLINTANKFLKTL